MLVKIWQFWCLPFVTVSVHEVFLTLKAKKKQLAVLLWIYHEPGQRQPQKKTFLKLSDYPFDGCCFEGWKPFIISNRIVVPYVLYFMHFIHYPKSTKTCKNRNINVVNHLDMWLLLISQTSLNQLKSMTNHWYNPIIETIQPHLLLFAKNLRFMWWQSFGLVYF